MQFLSEEFVSQWATIQRPLLGKATGLVVVKIDGAPEGKIAITAELENGLITNAYLGSGRGRDLELLKSAFGLGLDQGSRTVLHDARGCG